MSAVETTLKVVTMYICPTPDCASVTTVIDPNERLEEEWGGPKTENRAELQMKTGSPHTHNRAQCPFCKIQRVRLQVPVRVPTVGPPTPKPPPGTSRVHPMKVCQPEG